MSRSDKDSDTKTSPSLFHDDQYVKDEPASVDDSVVWRNEWVSKEEFKKDFYVSLAPYVAISFVLWIVAAIGVIPIQPLAWVTLYASIGLIVIYARIHYAKSITQRTALGILLFSCSVIVLGSWVLEIFRLLAVPLLSMALVFDLRRYSVMQTLAAAMLSMLFIVIGVVLRDNVLHGVAIFEINMKVLNGAFIAIPIVALVARRIKEMQRLLESQKIKLHAAFKTLSALVIRDPMTGVFNRRHMVAAIDQELRRFNRAGTPVCLCMLDIDFFKRINDTYGHTVGDAVLKDVASTCERLTRDVDVVGRWGGEEFVILMPGCNAQTSFERVSSIRSAMQTHNWLQHADGLTVTFSAGIHEALRTDSVESVLEKADEVLYAAKRNGRDRIMLSSSCSSVGDAKGVSNSSGTAQEESPPTFSGDRSRDQSLESIKTQVFPSSKAAADSTSDDVSLGLSKRVVSRFLDLLLGVDPAIRSRTPFGLIAAITGLLYLFYLRMVVYQNHTENELGIRIFTVYVLVSASAFYPLVRSGISQRLSEPSLSLPQLINALSGCALAYVLIPPTRDLVIQMMCVMQMFGMLRLAPSRTIIVGASAIALLGAAYGYVVLHDQDARLVSLRGAAVLLTFVVVTTIVLLSYRYSSLRTEQERQAAQLIQAIDQVNALASRDSLTGLFNRRYLMQRLDEECKREKEVGSRFCIALVDLDHFKRVNDTYGHHVGDEVLIGFSSQASLALRDTDLIARWGGEEFVVLFTDVKKIDFGKAGIDRVLLRMQDAQLSRTVPDLRVTFSAGIAFHRSGESVDDTIERADRALYEAKEAGRNRCFVEA